MLHALSTCFMVLAMATSYAYAQQAPPPKSPLFEQELRWVRSSLSQVAAASDQEYLADFLAQYPADQMGYVHAIVQSRATVTGVRRPQLEEIVKQTTSVAPPATERDALQTQLAA